MLGHVEIIKIKKKKSFGSCQPAQMHFSLLFSEYDPYIPQFIARETCYKFLKQLTRTQDKLKKKK